MKRIFMLSIGLLMSGACSLDSAAQIDWLVGNLSAPVADMQRAFVQAPLVPIQPRPVTRDELIDSFTSEEEEEDSPEAAVDGLHPLGSSTSRRAGSSGIRLAPVQVSDGVRRGPVVSRLRC